MKLVVVETENHPSNARNKPVDPLEDDSRPPGRDVLLLSISAITAHFFTSESDRGPGHATGHGLALSMPLASVS